MYFKTLDSCEDGWSYSNASEMINMHNAFDELAHSYLSYKMYV